jgi:hypothetical protein
MAASLVLMGIEGSVDEAELLTLSEGMVKPAVAEGERE